MQTRVSYICELNIVDGTSTLVFVSLAILTDFFFSGKLSEQSSGIIQRHGVYAYRILLISAKIDLCLF